MDLNIAKMLLEISNEKKKKHKEMQKEKQREKNNENQFKTNNQLNIEPEQYNINDALANFKCIECYGYKIKEIDGFYVCLNCGLKLESIIDTGQEWRNYNNDDNKGVDQSRCDMPTNELLPKSSMGGLVGWGGKESFTTKRIRNMSRWYSTTYKESSLLEIFNNITIIAINSGLNQCIIEEAKYMFKRVSEVKATRRTKKDCMKAGAIALACKLKGCPRNSNEIAKICRLKNNKTLRRGIKSFEEIWNNIILEEKQIDKKIKDNKKILKQNAHLSINSNVLNNNTDDNDNSNSDDDSSDDDSNDDDSSDNDSSDDNASNDNASNDNASNDNASNDNASNDNAVCDLPSDNANNINSNNINEIKSNYNKNDIDDDISNASNANPNNGNGNGNSKKINKTKLNNYSAKLHRFISLLGLDEQVYQFAKKVQEYIDYNNLLDKHNPLSQIAAVLFYTIERLKINIKKNQIIQICNVSNVTIDKCYQKLIQHKSALIKIELSL